MMTKRDLKYDINQYYIQKMIEIHYNQHSYSNDKIKCKFMYYFYQRIIQKLTELNNKAQSAFSKKKIYKLYDTMCGEYLLYQIIETHYDEYILPIYQKEDNNENKESDT